MEDAWAMFYCEKEKRDIYEYECDKWTCPHWVGNGGECIPTRKIR